MQRKRIAKSVALIMALLVTVSSFSGCGGGADPKGSESSTSTKGEATSTSTNAAEEPTHISVMTITQQTNPIDNTNWHWKGIEEKTNTKLDITFVPLSNYAEKFSVTLAAGNMPEVTLATDPLNPNVVTACKGGAFWEIGPYVKDYANIMKMPESAWTDSRIDGKNYALPRPAAAVGKTHLLSIRQDWLDKLNLKMPETPDEIYNVLKAFVNNDPDGNGQKDTQGLICIPAMDGNGFGNFAAIFGAFLGTAIGPSNVGYFISKDNGLKLAIDEPGFKQALLYLRKLYSEGLLHRDFATMKQQQLRDAAMAGKVGMTGEGIPGSNVMTEGLIKTDPKASFVALPPLKTVSGTRYSIAEQSYVCAYMIKKQGVDEAKLKSILSFFNKMADPEISDYANYGEKGVHWNRDGYMITQTDKFSEVPTGYMGQLALGYDEYIKYFYASAGMKTNNKARLENNIKIIDQQYEAAQPDPTIGLVVDSWTKISADYGKKITDNVIKFILGTETEQGWDAFVKDMLADQKLTQAVKDMDAAYKTKNTK